MHWIRRHRRGRPPHPDVLTPAEWRVLEQVRAGLTNAEIAVRMGVSINTVKTHVGRILAKTGMPDRHALAAWDGEPAEASRAALSRGFALPLAEWFTAGGALTGAKVTAGTVASVVFVVSVFAAYGFFFAEAAEEDERFTPERPPVTSVIDAGNIDDFEVGEVRTFALAADADVDPADMVIRVDEARHIQRTDQQIRDLHDPPFGFFVGRLNADEVIALAGFDPRSGCALLRWTADELAGRSDEAARLAPEGEGIFADPCHGSVYTNAGLRYFGPSGQDMHRYAVEVTDDERVLVDLSDLVEGERHPGTSGDATPTPVVPPTPAPTPAGGVIGHNLDVRTGEPTADAVIDAVLAKDLDALMALARFEEYPCVEERDEDEHGPYPVAPLCPEGLDAGTPAPRMVNVGCHAEMRTPETLPSAVRQLVPDDPELYLVSEDTESMLGAGYPQSEHFALFLRHLDDGSTWAWGIHIGQGGYVSITTGCGHSLDDFREVFGVTGPYLLPPPA